MYILHDDMRKKQLLSFIHCFQTTFLFCFFKTTWWTIWFMKIILRLLGCFLLAFRWGAVTRAGPRWLEAWFPWLLYCSFLPEPVLAFSQPGRWVTAPHLPSRLETSRFPWAAALTVLAVLVPDWQESYFPHLSSQDVFLAVSHSILNIGILL